MNSNISDKMSQFVTNIGTTFKSMIKIVIQSSRPTISKSAREGETLIIMGNGPSLATTIRDHSDILKSHDLMAVNFAANTDEFLSLKPKYYILADPLFFSKGGHTNVDTMYQRLSSMVDWKMKLFVPSKMFNVAQCLISNPNIEIETFNPVGVEGFAWAESLAFRSGYGMPRPRNVLIPAIMSGILAGYKKIAIAGADHSWMRTIEVNDKNEVISVQPHFYKDSDEEKSRVTTTYRNYRLHDIVYSFYVAFRSYFAVRRYADSHGIEIVNVTPDSFIDAFPRKNILEIDKQ